MVNSYPGSGVIPMIDYSFQVLDSVWENTKWQLVYDLDNLTIQYRILSDATIRTLDFSTFDFNCDSGTKLLELGDDPAVGANWKDYSTALNITLINTVCSVSSFVNSILGAEADDIAVYPESASCLISIIPVEPDREGIHVYPNPTSGYIFIECDDLQSVEILNQMGQLVYTGNASAINIESLPAGIYFVRLRKNKSNFVHKVIKE
ncbi:MAG: hypothetical protein C0592_08805 [Marinilabiliales bacterium]|nr:MAG: hypothetical protein C0592_08805 [Marinilabiliales bacterium]